MLEVILEIRLGHIFRFSFSGIICMLMPPRAASVTHTMPSQCHTLTINYIIAACITRYLRSISTPKSSIRVSFIRTHVAQSPVRPVEPSATPKPGGRSPARYIFN